MPVSAAMNPVICERIPRRLATTHTPMRACPSASPLALPADRTSLRVMTLPRRSSSATTSDAGVCRRGSASEGSESLRAVRRITTGMTPTLMTMPSAMTAMSASEPVSTAWASASTPPASA